MSKVVLGVVDYNGKQAEAIREEYPNGECLFVLHVEGDRIPMLRY